MKAIIILYSILTLTSCELDEKSTYRSNGSITNFNDDLKKAFSYPDVRTSFSMGDTKFVEVIFYNYSSSDLSDIKEKSIAEKVNYLVRETYPFVKDYKYVKVDFRQSLEGQTGRSYRLRNSTRHN